MNFIAIGSILGMLVVILGAFGAHGLKDILDDYGQSIYDKAVLYHMFHSIAILVLGKIGKKSIFVEIGAWSWDLP